MRSHPDLRRRDSNSCNNDRGISGFCHRTRPLRRRCFEALHGPRKAGRTQGTSESRDHRGQGSRSAHHQRIRERYPESRHSCGGVRCVGTVGCGEGKWIIDPLDGTTNFAHQYPFFCVSIGFEQAGRILCGAVYDPWRDEMFSGARGLGAFVNGSATAGVGRGQTSRRTDHDGISLQLPRKNQTRDGSVRGIHASRARPSGAAVPPRWICATLRSAGAMDSGKWICIPGIPPRGW